MIRKLKNSAATSNDADIRQKMDNVKFTNVNTNTNPFNVNPAINFNRKPVIPDSAMKKLTFDPQTNYEEPKRIVAEPPKFGVKPTLDFKFTKDHEKATTNSYSNVISNNENAMRDTKTSFKPNITNSFDTSGNFNPNATSTNLNSSISKIEDGFRSTMTKFAAKNFNEKNEDNGERQEEENNEEDNEKKEEKSFEEEYADEFDKDDGFNKDEAAEEDEKKDAGINFERINAQLKRARELKQIIKLEEDYFENMFNVDVVATSHSKLEKLAQGLCKNALTQTNEGSEFGTQTEQILSDEMGCQYGEGNITKPEAEMQAQVDNDTTISELPSKTKQNLKNVTLNYQPLGYESYKFFVKLAPTIEKILLNNNTRKMISESEQGGEGQNWAKILEFKFPPDLFTYLNISSATEFTATYNDFLFFDLNPTIFAVSYSLCFKNYSSSIFSNDSINLVLVINISSGLLDKVFYSFSKITSLAFIGEYEDIILAGREDGVLDVFDLKPINEKFYLNYENLNKNIIFYEDENEIKPEHYLKLATNSTPNLHNSRIVKLKKLVFDNNSYKIFSLDLNGNLVIWEILDKDIKEMHKTENLVIKKLKEIQLEPLLKREALNRKVRCLQFDISQKNTSRETVYVLTNFGLHKILPDVADQGVYSTIHNNDKEPCAMTAFALSDNGYFLCTFNDSSIKMIEEATKNVVLTISVAGADRTVLDKIIWSSVVCKGERNKIFRRDLLATFFVISKHNDFYIYDLKKDVKLPKKKIELGTKKGLNCKNSNILVTDSLFHDFSNLIVISNHQSNSLEIYKLKMRNKFFEAEKVSGFNSKMVAEILAKANQ